MLHVINRLLAFFDFQIQRTAPVGLKYSKPNIALVTLSILIYAAFGWSSLLLLSVNHDLGQRAAQCALSVTASPRSAWLFIAALIVFFLYLLRPEVEKLASCVPVRGKRLFWRWTMCLAYIGSGLFLAVGGVLLGISVHLMWLEQSASTLALLILAVITLGVGVAYKTQTPELLSRIRRSRKHPLAGLLVPVLCILALVAIGLVSAFTPFSKSLTAPTTALCPDIQVQWR